MCTCVYYIMLLRLTVIESFDDKRILEIILPIGGNFGIY